MSRASLRMAPTVWRRRAAMGLLLALAVSGCARPDWIESTLVTSEVAGHWNGSVGTRFQNIPLRLQLTQSGGRVAGSYALGARTTGQIEGSVNGDVLRFRQVDGDFSGELTIGIDEMTGWIVGVRTLWSGRSPADLKRE